MSAASGEEGRERSKPLFSWSWICLCCAIAVRVEREGQSGMLACNRDNIVVFAMELHCNCRTIAVRHFRTVTFLCIPHPWYLCLWCAVFSMSANL